MNAASECTSPAKSLLLAWTWGYRTPASQCGFQLSDHILMKSDKPSWWSRAPTRGGEVCTENRPKWSLLRRGAQSTQQEGAGFSGASRVILLRNIGRLFKCLLNSTSSLLIFSRPVICSLFYFGAASPTSDRVGVQLILAMSSLASDASLTGCSQKSQNPVLLVPALICMKPAGNFLCLEGWFFFPLSWVTINFLAGNNLWKHCVHDTLVHKVPGT